MKKVNVEGDAPFKKYLGVNHEVWLAIAHFANELGGIDKLLEEIIALRKAREATKQAALQKLLETV